MLRLASLLLWLLLSGCGAGGIDGARVGLPDVMPQARVAQGQLFGAVSADVDRPEPGEGVILDARPSLGVRFRWTLEAAPEQLAEAPLAWRIHRPDGPVTRFTANQPGRYRLAVTVENRSGHRARRTVEVVLQQGPAAGAPPPVPEDDADGDGLPDALDPDSDDDGVEDPLDFAPLDPAVQDWPRHLENEPRGGGNDRLETADAIPGTHTALQILGALLDAADRDFYRFTLAPGRYGLVLAAAGPLPRLRLLDAQERPLPSEHRQQGARPVWTLNLTQAETVLLVLSGEGAAGYTLSLYPDGDGDGLPDFLEPALGADPAHPDGDGDGLPDGAEALPIHDGGAAIDLDGDGRPPWLDPDSDGDGLSDAQEGLGDSDGDGLPDAQDEDADDNGLPDAVEFGPRLLVEGPQDSDGDGLPDYRDRDDDGDGLWDVHEPPGQRLRPAPYWNAEVRVGDAPRVDGLGELDGPSGSCRPGTTLVLHGARLPTDGEAWLALYGPHGVDNLAPSERRAERWLLPCPDRPPGHYRLRPYHDGRAGPALPLALLAPQAPRLFGVQAVLDGRCPSGYRLQPQGEALHLPWVLRLPGQDGDSRFASRITDADPYPCAPAGMVAGFVRLSTAWGDSAPVWFRPPARRPLALNRLPEDAVLESPAGAPSGLPVTQFSQPVDLAPARTTAVLAWNEDGDRLLGGGVFPAGEDEPVLQGLEVLPRLLVWLLTGVDRCIEGWDEAQIPTLEAAIAWRLHLEERAGLPLPMDETGTALLTAFLEALAPHLPEACRAAAPDGALFAFHPRQAAYAGRLAVKNATGLPAVLAYRDEAGRPLIPPLDGPIPAAPGWLPGPEARLIPGIYGQDGVAELISAGVREIPQESGVAPQRWRWAWLAALARALWPAFEPYRDGRVEHFALALATHAQGALDEALEALWTGAAVAPTLRRLGERLSQMAWEGALDPVLVRQGEALAWARRRLALQLQLMALGAETGLGPLATLAAAMEGAPPRVRYRIAFPPAVDVLRPTVLRRGGGGQTVAVLGRGLRAVDLTTLGYASRRLPSLEVRQEATERAWRFAPSELRADGRRLLFRLPAFLTETGEALTLTLWQPQEDGTVVALGGGVVRLDTVPQVQALNPEAVAPGGSLTIAGEAFAPRLEDHRAWLLDAAGTLHPLPLLGRSAAGLSARVPAVLAPGTYRLRLEVHDGSRWREARGREGEALPTLVVRPAPVAVRLCDAGSNQDDRFALYLDGVYQGSFQAGAALPARLFTFDLDPGSTHELTLELIDGGPNGTGTYGLEPVRGLAIFGGDPGSGELAPGERRRWWLRVAADLDAPPDNRPQPPICPSP